MTCVTFAQNNESVTCIGVPNFFFFFHFMGEVGREECS